MALAAPSSPYERTSDDETDSSGNSETDVIATNAQIQLVNKAKNRTQMRDLQRCLRFVAYSRKAQNQIKL
uniref:Uncharacterized protein n=1 Tax=Globodera rostochiensis TaxID=31243 RepID=A0A914HKE4_GLORO